MNYEDFIRPPQKKESEADTDAVETEETEGVKVEELDVQKAVVESFATEKAELELRMEEMTAEINRLKTENESLRAKVANCGKTQGDVPKLKALVEEMKDQLGRVGDILARNSETPGSNQISVLDRNEEVPDRFEGETRDHILEVLKEARDASEAEGRLRRAQILEAVLAVNEPCGTLAKRRAALDKLFADNQYVINGQVINELDKLDIRHKDGDKYLLAKEIIKRSY